VTINGDPRSSDGGGGARVGGAGVVEDEGAAHTGGPRASWIRLRRDWIQHPPEQGLADPTTGGTALTHPTQHR
jgi:hypothetical protein